MIKHVTILGVRVHALNSDEALKYLYDRLQHGQKSTIATVNTEFIVEAQRNLEFRQQLNDSDLATADGIGILWAARIINYAPKFELQIFRWLEVSAAAIYLGVNTIASKSARYAVIPEQITGVDFSLKLAKLAQVNNFKLFLLGERSGVAEEAAQKINALYPGEIIAGVYAGDGSPSGDVGSREEVSKHPAEIILVAYGAPKQELWIRRNMAHIPAQIAMGVGGTFMFLSGRTRRAPQVFRRFGVEWLYRLVTQPWRWKRQLALPYFIFLVVRAIVATRS